MSNWRDVRPPVPPVQITDVPHIDERVLGEFAQYTSEDVADLVGPLYVLDPAIRPLHPGGAAVAGTAMTVKAVPGDNRAIIAALAFAGAGDILVVDWRGYTGACGSGAKVLAGPQAAGLRAVVIDGAWRDLEEVEALGLPVYGRARSAVSPIKSHLGEINVPVHCGGVVVCAGDLVLVGPAGVVVIPRFAIGSVQASLPQLSSAEESLDKLSARSVARREAYLEAFDAAGGHREPSS